MSRGRLGRCRGQALVETALVLPIIILILMGIIDFGLMFNNYLIISNASREGARSAAVGSNDAYIISMVTDLTSTLDTSKRRIDIEPKDYARKRGQEVTVTIEYDNDLLTPVIAAIVPNPVHLTAKTVMRVE